MSRNRGFTLLENMLGLLVLMTAVAVMVPLFTQDLILGSMMRERRLAAKLIQSDLDWACNFVRMPTPFTTPTPPTAVVAPRDDVTLVTVPGQQESGVDFNELRPATFPPFVAPVELRDATIARSVTCLDGALTPTIPAINPDGSCPDGPDPDLLPETIKRVQVSVTWTSRKGNPMSEQSAAYFISRVGMCGS